MSAAIVDVLSNAVEPPANFAAEEITSVCGSTLEEDHLFGLRVASIFVILVGATGGAVFPVLARRSQWLNIPKGLFNFTKYFGSGVIIATAFIHLLNPALEALGSECLPEGWHEYPYALALCLTSILCLFVVELVAFRWGTSKLERIGKSHDPHGHGLYAHAAHGPETSQNGQPESEKSEDLEAGRHHHNILDSAVAQIVGIAILEFGVVLHSLLIGLTLAVDESFKILFIVLVFHQTFEGLGLGSRLAHMNLPVKYNWVPITAAIVYGLTTPLGIAVGLGVRSTYNPEGATASMVSGVLDAISSGILIYTGLVELLAHDFLFNQEMIKASNSELAMALLWMFLGVALMALLGKWA